MADIDDFKSCNDLKGHDCGDGLLKSLADRLRGAVRRGDLVSRWGGDEFLILLPETGPSGGRAAAKKIQAVVSRHPFPYKGHRIRLRISLGCGVFKAGQDIDGCLKEADQAMLLRKRAAKNSRTPAGAGARRAS